MYVLLNMNTKAYNYLRLYKYETNKQVRLYSPVIMRLKNNLLHEPTKSLKLVSG